MAKAFRSDDAIELALRDAGMKYPEATEDFPWEHRALKVRNKVFVFLGTNDKGLFASFKLPDSHPLALELSFAEPTGYGLGKHGWVSVQFQPDDEVPVEMLEAWIDESYRAIAPKKLVAQLPDDEPAVVRPARRSPKKAPAKKKPSAKKKPTRK